MRFDIAKLFKRVSLKEKAFLARQLATMIGAGLPLTESLSTLEAQTRNRYFKEVLASVLADLDKGASFSTAIGKFPDVFDAVFTSVIKAGEVSGKLENVLTELADQLEKENALSSIVKSALIYPAFIMVSMIGVGVLMMIKVIPQLKIIFEEAKVPLPIPTRILIFLSGFILHYWYICIILIILAIIGFKLFFSSPFGIALWNTFEIKTPIVREFTVSIYMVRFCRTLGMLISSEIPIIEALKISGDIINNVVYKQSFGHIAQEVERGIPMSVPIAKDKNFPPILTEMIRVGEETGKLDDILANLARYFENETNAKIKGLFALFEPAVLLLIGIAVGVMVFAIIMPIYQIAQIQ